MRTQRVGAGLLPVLLLGVSCNTILGIEDHPHGSETSGSGATGKGHSGGAKASAGASTRGGQVGTSDAAGSGAITNISEAGAGTSVASGGSAPVGGAENPGGNPGQAGVGNGGTTVAGGTMGVAGAPSSGGDATSIGGAAAAGTPSTGGAVGVAGMPSNSGAAIGGTAGTATSNGGTATGGTENGGTIGVAGGLSNGGTATGGTSPSTGGAATGGAPSTGGAGNCVIETVAYPSETKKLGNACLVCNPANSTIGWSLVSDGTTCDGGKVCTSGTCQAGCWIGTYRAPNESNTTNPCLTCQPATLTSDWSPLAEGDSCDTGQVCHGGTCQPGCWIGETYRAADAANPNGLCQACKPGTSTTAWTADAVSCGCTGALQNVQEATGLCVATMVPIPGPTTATNYNIDGTEVTRKQYAMWLATTTAATVSGQDSATCGWNTTFAADTACMAIGYVCQTNCDSHPQVCVDWCDAYAYCRGIGKRLCGKIGGGPNLYADYASATLSEWYRACSSAGSFTYPYGNTYSGTTCNGYDHWGSTGTMTTLAVGALTGCKAAAPYDGAYDLSGNVLEWEDSCDSTTAGSSASCRVRGGSFYSHSSDVVCGSGGSYGDRSYVSFGIGLRCCSP
jgi:formylglycine-generating enzyme